MGSKIPKERLIAEYGDGCFLLDEYPVEMRLRILAAQMYAADGLGTWCIWGSGREKMYSSTCIHEDAFYSFLELGHCLSFMAEREEGCDRPVIFGDALGLTWIAEHAHDPSGEKLFLSIVGPIFLSSSSQTRVEHALAERLASVETRRNLMRTMNGIPVMPLTTVIRYSKMLHITLSNSMAAQSDIMIHSEPEECLREDEEPERGEEAGYGTSDDRRRRREQMILTAVREGNLRYREIEEKELSWSDQFLSCTGDDLRDGKISVTVFNAQCSRAAVEGGLSGRTATELETRYYSEIEACRSIVALKKVMNRMMSEYVNGVARSRENEEISRTVRDCCDYIRANAATALTTEGIAAQMGYSPYYLTKKFHKETGIKLGDYIKQTRIEYAKLMLLTTNKSVLEISEMLQFGNRNYFTRIFTDITGMTPTAFREHANDRKNGDV